MKKIGYQFVSYVCVSFFMFALIVVLIIYTLKNLPVLGARYFLLTLLLAGIWIAAQGLEMSAIDLKTKIMWANVQYAPLIFIPLAYLYFTLHFTRNENILRKKWILFLLMIAPIAFNILVWTNSSHHLIRRNIFLDMSGAFPTVGKTYGPILWFFAAYNYGVTILTAVLLFKRIKR